MRTLAKIMAAAGAVTFGLTATAALADPITLTFDELNGGVNEGPASYYAGGFGSAGTGPGPDYGITFSANTITGCVDGSACDNTNAAEPPSFPNIIFFLDGGADTMDVAGGFDTGFSFYYSAVNEGGIVNVWSGLDATGTLLATLDLPITPSGTGTCTSAFCPFVAFGVTFEGTAHSVDFGGTANQIAFDNITLGSDTPGGGDVPEPSSWALMITGFGLVGAGMRRRHTRMTQAV